MNENLEKQISKSKAMLNEKANHIKGKPEKSFLSIKDVSKGKFEKLLFGGIEVKQNPEKFRQALKNKSVALLFQKTSTRTRCSFEIGVGELGGQPMYIDWRTSNFTLASLEDEIKVLSRYVDLIMARVYKNEDLQTMKKYSEVPIINGLCNFYHPCQSLTDYMTILEYYGKLKGLKMTYIGDGNNVCNSLINGAIKTGIHITVATPKGHEPKKEVIEEAKKTNSITLIESPEKAVENADIIYTDTWISMGQENQKEKKLKAFKNYSVTEKLLKKAPEHAIIMHCLPAHRGYEIEGKVLTSKNSVVFDQAENRKHAQKYLMIDILDLV